jgi:serine protease Do
MLKKLLFLLCVPGLVFAQTSGADVRISFASAVERVSPAVVNIYATKVVREPGTRSLFNDPLFDALFGNGFAGPMRKRVEKSLGSGVILTKEGHFVTNFHVIEGAQNIRAIFNDGLERPARLLSADPQQDLAVMQLELQEGDELQPASLADAATLKVGDVVLAIGNPFGFGQSVSMGVVSALGRNNVGSGPASSYIQTDAAINPGNSGGALVDSNGQVVGINTIIFSRNGGNQGVGFAVPANAVDAVLTSVLSTGKVQRPWLGVDGQDLTLELAEQLGIERAMGVLIHTVISGSPGDRSGVQVGDVIRTIGSQPIHNKQALQSILNTLKLGDSIQLGLWRTGELLSTTLQLEPVPARPMGTSITLKGSHPMAGYEIEDLSIGLNYEFGLSLKRTGVAVVGLPTRQPFGLHLQAGDIIESINGKRIRTTADMQAALSKRSTKGWNISIRRGEARFEISIIQ